MMRSIPNIRKVRGRLKLPGDKSVSHRAVLFSAMAKGKSEIYNCLNSADVNSSIACVEMLGAEVERLNDKLIIRGKGKSSFEKPQDKLYAGNSGTTARLLSGILAAQKFPSVITGDESLSKRPMQRITYPLELMGAKTVTENGRLPLKIFPSVLKPIDYTLPVPSAQVKSAIILAGVHLSATTKIIEPVQCRNHTELMLELPVEKSENGNVISVNDSFYPESNCYYIPSDISTAAFFIVLALILPDSDLVIENILLNETRAGIIDILTKMNADIEVMDLREISGEKVGDLRIKSSELKNIEIPHDVIPNLIDEIPILSVAGLFAEGVFTVKNAGELRAKESDRIYALVENYRKLNIEVEEFEDGFSLYGSIKSDFSPVFESFGDHRIAMAFAVLSSCLQNGGSVDGFDSVAISNPQFIRQLNSIAS